MRRPVRPSWPAAAVAAWGEMEDGGEGRSSYFHHRRRQAAGFSETRESGSGVQFYRRGLLFLGITDVEYFSK
jgi:hypothetical protein